MFYELTHSLNPSDLQFNEGDRLSFPSHLRGSFEFIVITSGECTVTVDKKVYRVTPEAAVLVFPNQVHSMESPTLNTFFLLHLFIRVCQGIQRIRLPESAREQSVYASAGSA